MTEQWFTLVIYCDGSQFSFHMETDLPVQKLSLIQRKMLCKRMIDSKKEVDNIYFTKIDISVYLWALGETVSSLTSPDQCLYYNSSTSLCMNCYNTTKCCVINEKVEYCRYVFMIGDNL